VACTIENQLAPDVSWRRVETFNPRRHPIAPVFHLSIACNHCADAACMNACPALAYRRDAPTSAVLLDGDSCIGCGYCAWACPYDAPVFDESAGVMTKCTWCADRLRAGLKPACATHCPTGALDFTAIAPGERVQALEGLPATALDPRLHVIPLLPGRTQPEMQHTDAAQDFSPAPSAEPRAPDAQISLRHEWPLAAFTLAAASLVGLVAGAATGVRGIPAWACAIAAAAAMALSSAHLGRPLRAWRALLNVRRSWLSREVAALSLFSAVTTLWLWLAPESRVPGWTAAAIGFAGLFAADQLYGVLPSGPGHGHSASVMWTGILLATIATGERELAVIVGLAKLAVFARLRWIAVAKGRPSHPLLVIARAGLTLAAIVSLLAPAFPGGWVASFALALGGDAVDRCLYYMELERETPRRQMDQALAARREARRSNRPAAILQPASRQM
jgi:Fe-S-cluster-containing dehydrogenase component/DMSO reductase anchor subunit